MVEESGEVRSTERDGEDRSLDVESATIAPGPVNSESGIAAILMMERNCQEDRKREHEDRERELSLLN